jgi:threonine/homoserine/homoserine lactone efflux protein
VLVALLIGLAVGFLGSVPVAGPIAALVVERGLSGRFRSGAYVALGGALPEAAYAYLACWGFSTFLLEYAWIEIASRGAAAVLLVGLGVTFARYRSKAAGETKRDGDGAFRNFWIGFTITALNPTLIATWTAATTTLYAIWPVRLGVPEAAAFAGGAMVGILAWFMLLLVLMRRYRSRFRKETLDRAIRVVGVFLLVLATWFAWRFVSALLG